MFLSAGLDRAFGFEPMPFYAASILLHALCVLLLYALGIWLPVGRPAAFLARPGAAPVPNFRYSLGA